MNESLNSCTVQRRMHALLMAVLMMACTSLQAQSKFEEDFDDTEKPWQEIVVQLPAAPKPENLIPFYVSPTATYTFAIDAKSLTVGSDAVVRYTVVAKSAGGAENINYEGIRCKAREKKVYAFGRKDGSWSRSRRDKWEPVTQHASNPHQSALMQDFFCEGESVAGDAEDLIHRLRAKPISEKYMPK